MMLKELRFTGRDSSRLAPKSTIYHFSIDVSDTDRGVYQEFKLPVALHPSESLEFMLTRVLAYTLEFDEGIAFSAGIGATEEPPLAVRNFDGTYRCWVETGAPNPDRVHRAAKAASRVAIYTHRPAHLVLEQLSGGAIFRAADIPLYSFEDGFIPQLVGLLDRRNQLVISRSEQVVYLNLNGQDRCSSIIEQRLA
jgi:uncharacterized protein YaeQ